MTTSHHVDSLIYTRRVIAVITSLSATLGTTTILPFKFNLWNFGIECLLMLQLVREAINCHTLYSYLNHFWCSLFHIPSQWRHVKEWENKKTTLVVIRTDPRQFFPVCVSPGPGFFFFFFWKLVLKLPIFNVTKLYNFFDVFSLLFNNQKTFKGITGFVFDFLQWMESCHEYFQCFLYSTDIKNLLCFPAFKLCRSKRTHKCSKIMILILIRMIMIIVKTLYQHIYQVSRHLKYYYPPGVFNIMIIKL